MAHVTDIWFGSGTIRREWPYVIIGAEIRMLYDIQGSDFAVWNEVFAPYKNVYIKRADTASPEVYGSNGNYLGGIEPLNIMMKTQPVVGLYIDGNLTALQYHQSGGRYFFAFTIDKPGTHTIQLATNEGSSKVLYVEAIEGHVVPMGNVGVGAVILQDWNKTITFDSRIDDPELQENALALFPIICVENNVKANRQVSVDFFLADEHGNVIGDRIGGFPVRSGKIDGKETSVLHEFDRVFLNFTSNKLQHHARTIFELYPRPGGGKFKLGVKAKVHMFFENEKPEEEVDPEMVFADFELVDIAPRPGKLTILDMKFTPNEPDVPNDVEITFRNDFDRRMTMRTMVSKAIQINGETIPATWGVDFTRMVLGLEAGQEHTMKFDVKYVPKSGETYTICYRDDGTEMTFVDNDGVTKTKPIVEYLWTY